MKSSITILTENEITKNNILLIISNKTVINVTFKLVLRNI